MLKTIWNSQVQHMNNVVVDTFDKHEQHVNDNNSSEHYWNLGKKTCT